MLPEGFPFHQFNTQYINNVTLRAVIIFVLKQWDKKCICWKTMVLFVKQWVFCIIYFLVACFTFGGTDDRNEKKIWLSTLMSAL